jgi:hypothetical protein
MVIVFDAGPMTADRMFKRADARALLHEASEDRLRVVVPRAVFEEVVRATDGWLRSAKKNLSSARHNLNEAFIHPPMIPEIDVDALLQRYRDELEQRLLQNNVVIADWSQVNHEEIVARDLAGKPPFDKSGRGYRDTLTWHVIRDLVVNEGERVIFVTTDKDFSADDDPSVLHRVLVDETGGRGDAVTIVTDLAEVIRVLGDLHDEFAARLLETVEAQSSSLGTQALWHIGEKVLPYGMQSKVAEGWINRPEASEVFEAWGVWSAVVNGELEYQYTGTLNEMEFDMILESVARRSSMRSTGTPINGTRRSLGRAPSALRST